MDKIVVGLVFCVASTGFASNTRFQTPAHAELWLQNQCRNLDNTDQAEFKISTKADLEKAKSEFHSIAKLEILRQILTIEKSIAPFLMGNEGLWGNSRALNAASPAFTMRNRLTETCESRFATNPLTMKSYQSLDQERKAFAELFQSAKKTKNLWMNSGALRASIAATFELQLLEKLFVNWDTTPLWKGRQSYLQKDLPLLFLENPQTGAFGTPRGRIEKLLQENPLLGRISKNIGPFAWKRVSDSLFMKVFGNAENCTRNDIECIVLNEISPVIAKYQAKILENPDQIAAYNFYDLKLKDKKADALSAKIFGEPSKQKVSLEYKAFIAAVDQFLRNDYYALIERKTNEAMEDKNNLQNAKVLLTKSASRWMQDLSNTAAKSCGDETDYLENMKGLFPSYFLRNQQDSERYRYLGMMCNDNSPWGRTFNRQLNAGLDLLSGASVIGGVAAIASRAKGIAPNATRLNLSKSAFYLGFAAMAVSQTNEAVGRYQWLQLEKTLFTPPPKTINAQLLISGIQIGFSAAMLGGVQGLSSSIVSNLTNINKSFFSLLLPPMNWGGISGFLGFFATAVGVDYINYVQNDKNPFEEVSFWALVFEEYITAVFLGNITGAGAVSAKAPSFFQVNSLAASKVPGEMAKRSLTAGVGMLTAVGATQVSNAAFFLGGDKVPTDRERSYYVDWYRSGGFFTRLITIPTSIGIDMLPIGNGYVGLLQGVSQVLSCYLSIIVFANAKQDYLDDPTISIMEALKVHPRVFVEETKSMLDFILKGDSGLAEDSREKERLCKKLYAPVDRRYLENQDFLSLMELTWKATGKGPQDIDEMKSQMEGMKFQLAKAARCQ